MIAAVVLAAGLSRRMGRPKMVLAWGGRTVIAQVVSTLQEAGLERILVVTGGENQVIETALAGSLAGPVDFVQNPSYQDGEMIHSIQVGLKALPTGVRAALITLGDQPQIQAEIVRAIIQSYQQGGHLLILPSFQKHRGHPWLIDRSLWAEVLALQSPQTLRDFLRAKSEQIHYLEVDSSSILQDLDTPEDYQRFRPE
jgi:molybdenum cofactor cytidylyltransferase